MSMSPSKPEDPQDIEQGQRQTIILAHLSSNDLLCPSCGYNLRHATSLKCPECGGLFDDLDIDHLSVMYFDIRFEKKLILSAVVLILLWLLILLILLIVLAQSSGEIGSWLFLPGAIVVLLGGVALQLMRARKNTRYRLTRLPIYCGSSWIGAVSMVIIIAAGMPLALILLSFFR